MKRLLQRMSYVPEPFRIKAVEPVTILSAQQRRDVLIASHYNIFNVPADDVYIDFLTDSGTGAMSAKQWGAIMQGDESYAGARSFYHLEESVKDIFGFKHFTPTHQGRASEHILCTCLVKDGVQVPSNMHFDTTEANIKVRGGNPVNIVVKEAFEMDNHGAFKGNMDIPKLRQFIEKVGAAKIPFGMMTVTNNSAAGQPVSMANIREASLVFKQFKIPFFIDAARYAENCFFIKEREPGYQTKSLKEIAREMFSYADGMTMSSKKDGLVNIGGLLACNDDTLFERIKVEMTIREGFPTYGGQAGRDLECLAVGLQEALNDDYLCYRIGQVRYLCDRLTSIGVPVVLPAGGHAVYVDAGALLPHIPPKEFPGQALACELYLRGGIRACEIGTVMFGESATEEHRPELLRMAIPRRVYTQAHFDYVVGIFAQIKAERDKLKGYRFTYAPQLLRHFTGKFAPL